MSKIQQTVCTSVADRQYIEQFEFQVDMLIGLVLEAVEISPAMLLSPVIRQLLVEKAKQVRSMFDTIKRRIAVDNPGDDLKSWKE